MKKATKIIALGIVCALSVMLLCACGAPNKDHDKAASALKDNGYTVVNADDAVSLAVVETALSASGDLIAMVTATKSVEDGDSTKIEHVTILYFKDSSAANDFWEEAQEYAKGEDSDEDSSDWSINKSGAMIYFGTSAAIKAAK